jgi:SAM-dependent methyltransferase
MFSLTHLNALRSVEIEKIAGQFPAGARILEVGAGTGQQALALSQRGFSVEAIEIPDSNYATTRVFGITDYDGRHIPFPDASFDIVFSSNVLEHVPDLVQMHAEIRRVLKPGGHAVHVLPTHAWRFWTTLSSFPAAIQYASTLGRGLIPPLSIRPAALGGTARAWLQAARHLASPFFQRRHGERGNTISETWLFHPSWWRRNFRENGFEIAAEEPMGLFYTGNMVFADKWSIEKRARLSASLGSACHLFKLAAAGTPGKA